MKFAFAAALALLNATSIHPQTAGPVASAAPAPLDLTFATPIAGTWSYAATAGGSEAVFRDSSARPQLTISCARALRQVTLSKPASAAAPFLFVWTSSLSKSFPATFDAAQSRLSVTLAAGDTVLDAVAYSRGRFGISVTGAPALVLPSWAEPVRVIEDCRG
jgi:hypothetical protein